MGHNQTRRKFIKQTGMVALGAAALNSYANSGTGVSNFKQSPLTYSYGDLAMAIDAQTMEIHYTKHAAAYVKNLNDALAKDNISVDNLDDLISNISKYSTTIRNNGGGHYNHEFFWKCMAPPRPNQESTTALNTLQTAGLTDNLNQSNMPSQNLMMQFQNDFGGFANFKNLFSQAALSVFGSGWVWLINDYNLGKLNITTTANQDNPFMDISKVKGRPLLALDCWEHAYYLRYQNLRKNYIENWWQVVNWFFVDQNFASSNSC
ncbi:MAG: superoxide dismutase [Sediminibacterium sp.]|nr:superoxide dismutase [Sediminibacterium sp.]